MLKLKMLKGEGGTGSKQGGSNGSRRPKRVERFDIGGGSGNVGTSHGSARHECEFRELSVTFQPRQ